MILGPVDLIAPPLILGPVDLVAPPLVLGPVDLVAPSIFVNLNSLVNTQNLPALSTTTTLNLTIIAVNSLNHLYLPLESRHLVLNKWSKY